MDPKHMLRALGHRPTKSGRIPRRMPAGPAIGPIEDNVPLPRPKNNGGLRKQIRALKPGQSFVTSFSKSGCYQAAKDAGIKINVRLETESTIRVWRIDDPEEE